MKRTVDSRERPRGLSFEDPVWLKPHALSNVHGFVVPFLCLQVCVDDYCSARLRTREPVEIRRSKAYTAVS